jgi:hypothetical protein
MYRSACTVHCLTAEQFILNPDFGAVSLKSTIVDAYTYLKKSKSGINWDTRLATFADTGKATLN